ncbi:MAG TPA: sulfite exporter TauE/SafE family protein [Burkholderiales bacterium]|nr:sulfite exporter TauE/SafE family protein [Burkholderiales bacterium]
MDWWWAYLAVGALVGFLSGLLGIGGGAALVPALAFIFAAKGFPQSHAVHLALGTCVSTMLFTSASSVLSHQQHKAVNWRVLAGMLPGVMLGTFAGGLLASRLDARSLSIAFTALIYYVATLMLLDRKLATPRDLPGTLVLSAVSSVIGLISSLTATGGGSLMTPYLVRRGLTVHQAIGTAVAIGWPLALGGTLGYVYSGMDVSGLPEWSFGFVYLPALAWVVAASMSIAPLGARIAHRTPARTLKRVFAVVLYALATGMLLRFF